MVTVETLAAVVGTMETAADVKYEVTDVATTTDSPEEMVAMTTTHPEMDTGIATEEKPFNRDYPVGVTYSTSVEVCVGYRTTGAGNTSQFMMTSLLQQTGHHMVLHDQHHHGYSI